MEAIRMTLSLWDGGGFPQQRDKYRNHKEM